MFVIMALFDSPRKGKWVAFFIKNHMPFGRGPPWLLLGLIAADAIFSP